jgi:hypothetical protein
MTELKIAAKVLRKSDLTLFRSQYLRLQSVSKQKAINLNREVFIDRFYPGLHSQTRKFHLRMEIKGPGGKPPYRGTATALVQQKNWRLDGRLIEDPPDDVGRFAALDEGDIAVLAFEGSTEPEAVTVILISATLDATLHAALGQYCGFSGRESMKVLEYADLEHLLLLPASEILEPFLSPDSIEEVFSLPARTQRPESDGRGAAISQDLVQTQAAAAIEVGMQGEQAFDAWLKDLGNPDDAYEWVSIDHARAAFDFDVKRAAWPRGSPSFVDVKATRGKHEAALHMSIAEVSWAAQHPSYRLARVSQLTHSSAHVAILAGIHELSRGLLSAVKGLPSGTSVDSMRIDPRLLSIEFESDVNW